MTDLQLIHLDGGDLIIMVELIPEVPSFRFPQHAASLALIDYMPLMGIRCMEMDRGLRANTTFRNMHGVGHPRVRSHHLIQQTHPVHNSIV